MNSTDRPQFAGVEAAGTLDPEDWDEFSRLAHEALDMIVEHTRALSLRPVWQQTPQRTLDRFSKQLPRASRDFASVLDDIRSDILPYGTGNGHPSFFGWVHGGGTPYGMVAEMLAAGLNANCGGRNHVAIEVERQIARWAAQMLDYPTCASGLFVTGTSMANFMALLVARDAALGHEVRHSGICGAPQLVGYASAQAHGCIGQAFELSGIGSDWLRKIDVDASGRMILAALQREVIADRQAGRKPFLVIGTAGTGNTGAIDDLEGIARIADQEGLWFHVDGAFGALAALSPRLRPLLRGIERSRSVAFDFHKWAHVPYDAGFLLVREGQMHRSTFASPAAYLQRLPRGLGSGDIWPCDLGPDLSRGFRALKVWTTIQTLGADRIASAIEKCCDLAAHLEDRLRRSDFFEPAAQVRLNVVCFRLRDRPSSQAHETIVMELQERGIAAPSTTTLHGMTVIRAAIVNHRTLRSHVDGLIDAAEECARRLPRA